MLQVCSWLPVASADALAALGLGGFAVCLSSAESCERRTGSGSRLCGDCGAGDAEWLISGFRILIISL